MMGDRDTARVQTLDVAVLPEMRLEVEGIGRINLITHSSRGTRLAEDDWHASAAPILQSQEAVIMGCAMDRGFISGRLRLEWIGDAEEWLDVIGEGPEGLLFRLRLQPGEDGPRVVGLELRASGGAIGTGLLRKLGLGDEPTSPLGLLNQALEFDQTVGELAGGKWRRRVKRRGRQGRPDVDYALWARDYVAAIEADPRAPIKYLVGVEKAAGRYRTENEIRAYLNKARNRGLLTKASPGQPGGDLTPKAKILLGLS